MGWTHPVRRLLAAQERAWDAGGPTGVLLAGGLVRSAELLARAGWRCRGGGSARS